MSGTLLIRGGRVIDPDTGRDGVLDLLIRDGKIVLGMKSIGIKADRVINASGCFVMPGLIDMHVHLRDPGLTEKEDIASGAEAAARGGITTVIAMPNTKPVIDSGERVDYVVKKAASAPVHVLQAGAVTEGQKGEKLSNIEEMVQHGIPAISEDGKSVMNARLCKEAMKIAAKSGIPFLDHCEDRDLVNGGCVNEDEISRKEGLPGIGNDVEDVIVARDIILAAETGVHLHLCHCSTRGSYEMLKLAKRKGIDVSGEVCPHHFMLCSEDRVPGDTNFKMNPPLRTKRDREALLEGLATDVFEVISTDHAPHTPEDKNKSMKDAAFGISGLETSVALTITGLVRPGVITPMQMAAKMSANPARILHLTDRGSLAEGKTADITIIDPYAKYRINSKKFVSKGKNTPFDGREVFGRVMYTICGGKVVSEIR
ncbi:MAG: dihydroorotase [Bilifractor sp.]|jgi:dihydroorotase